MEFGYFTLSDNHYDDNKRGANQFVADILDEAVYAEEVGGDGLATDQPTVVTNRLGEIPGGTRLTWEHTGFHGIEGVFMSRLLGRVRRKMLSESRNVRRPNRLAVVRHCSRASGHGFHHIQPVRIC